MYLFTNNLPCGFLTVILHCADVLPLLLQVMKTYHMYNTDSINAESKLKEAEKQEEKQMSRSDRQTPRSPDTLSSIKAEDKPVRRSSVKKIEKMKEKVRFSLLSHASSLLMLVSLVLS